MAAEMINRNQMCNLEEKISAITTAPAIEQIKMTPESRATNNARQANEMTPKQAPHLFNLQRDLDSPSAALRIRALRAIKSPTKAIYNNFDVPHEEISIITAEERNPCPPPTLSEILKDVIVYVEVRTGNDNRSEGVKSIIGKLGAQVNDRLLRNTTHVVFKDGLQSTYKRAQAWNIPIVSILWIEACKVQRRICEPKQFPISNIHIYEYPELYGKVSRVRCMQPDSELNKRPRKRQGTPTGTKDKEVTKKTSDLNTPTTTPKNDITRFFKPLSQNKQLSEGELTDSPATRLLNRITNGCFTPLKALNEPDDCAQTNTTEPNVIGDAPSKEQPAAKKSLNYSQEKRVEKPRSSSVTVEPIKPVRVTRRSTSMLESTRIEDQVLTTPRLTRRRSLLNLSQTSSIDEHLSQPAAKPLPLPQSEPRLTRRRSLQLSAPSAVESTTEIPEKQESQISRRRSFSTISTAEPSTPKIVKKPSFQAIAEEPSVETASNLQSHDISSSNVNTKTPVVNITNYVQQTMDISMSRADIIGKATGRRTLYTSEHMEISTVNVENVENINPYLGYSVNANVTTQTSLDSIGGQTTPVPVFSSTRLPERSRSSVNRRQSLFNFDMELFKERISKTNSTSQRRSLALANEAELGESRALAPLPAVSNEQKPTEPKMRILYTPNEEIALSPSASSLSNKSRHSIRGTTPSTCTVKRRRSLAGPKPTAAVGPILQKDTKSNAEKNPYVSPAASHVDTDTTSELHDDCVIPASKRRTIHTLVHTNMHRDQVQVIHKAIRKLRGMRLDPAVTKRTTHLVSLEPRRTLNLLRGLMRGVWIVSYEWILESMQAGKWLGEERYELTSFSRAVEICRTERQAFGASYRCELFRYMEVFYVSSLCRPITLNNIKELLLLGSAKITENRYKAKFIVGDKRRAEDDRIYLAPAWVLDSITAMQVQKFGKYLMKCAIVTPHGIRYEDPSQELEEQHHHHPRRHLKVCYRDPALVINK